MVHGMKFSNDRMKTVIISENRDGLSAIEDLYRLPAPVGLTELRFAFLTIFPAKGARRAAVFEPKNEFESRPFC